MDRRIPLLVIGGFLGAGKTTLLNRWLDDPGPSPHEAGRPRRLAVLVNDFGAINLDAALVATRDADTVALSNGCVCCSLGEDLGAALAGVLDRRPPPEAVVVEASGVGDPWRIAQFALVEPRLQLAGVLVLVDAAALPDLAADARLVDSLATPLAHADLVLQNHADRATPDQLQASRDWVGARAPGVPQLATVQAGLDLGPLLDLPEAQEAPHAPLHRARGSGHAPGPGWAGQPARHGQQFEALSLDGAALAPAYRRDRLQAWLRSLPPAVLRLKALLPLDDGRLALLHWAGRHGSLRAAPPGAGQAALVARVALVAIALRGELPVARLQQGLAACRAEDGLDGPGPIGSIENP
ncbi:MAG: GTP-binding protein [Burkholderiaceae bacterium]|nr:GTP-binding protein [Burkholderiaceae bacterium]